MKIMFYSDPPYPLSQSGYGMQLAITAPRIKALGHEVAITVVQTGANSCIWNGIHIFPTGFAAGNMDVLADNARYFEADAVISLKDMGLFVPSVVSKFRWIPMIPLHNLYPTNLHTSMLNLAWQFITYSKHATRAFEALGKSPHYIPHAVDTKTFYPIPQEKARIEWDRDNVQIAKAEGKEYDPIGDRFVAGMVAANQKPAERKAFSEVLCAWTKFARERGRDKVRLIIHTHVGGVPGYNLQGLIGNIEQLLRGESIMDTVVFPSEYIYTVGAYTPTDLALLYNCMDVLLSPSRGEGFGLPILEAQACGTPVIVGDWTAMSELCFAGWKVEGQPEPTADGFWMAPSIQSIYEKLNFAWECRGDAGLEECAATNAKAYDIDLVVKDYWKPVLQLFDEMIHRGGGLKEYAGKLDLGE